MVLQWTNTHSRDNVSTSLVIFSKSELFRALRSWKTGWTKHSGLGGPANLQFQCMDVAACQQLHRTIFYSWLGFTYLSQILFRWQGINGLLLTSPPVIFNFIARCSHNRFYHLFSAALTTQSCCNDACRYRICVTKRSSRLGSAMHIYLHIWHDKD